MKKITKQKNITKEEVRKGLERGYNASLIMLDIVDVNKITSFGWTVELKHQKR